jgi:hypothetical protein
VDGIAVEERDELSGDIHSAPAVPNDGLGIPDYLRRTPKNADVMSTDGTTDDLPSLTKLDELNGNQARGSDPIPELDGGSTTSHATLKPTDPAEIAISIPRPSTFDLDKFKSTRAAAVASVETLQTALPHHSIAQAKDFVRLHSNEETHWSPELCFVNVPIKGQKRDTLHLIEEQLAMRYLQSARVLRFRLALASKPFDVFFLCHVPTHNLDNSWNTSNVQACELAKTYWTQATSRRGEGVDAYKIDFAKDPDAFPEPKWPMQSLADLIDKTFAGYMIDSEVHPGLLRLTGAKQITS